MVHDKFISLYRFVEELESCMVILTAVILQLYCGNDERVFTFTVLALLCRAGIELDFLFKCSSL